MKQFGAFTLDTVNECLWRDGERIPIPPKPFAVLRYLVEHPNRLVSHDELLDALWPETYVQPQILRTYMLDLRKILADDARNPRFIQSIPKRGYDFMAPVKDTARPLSPLATAGSLFGRDRELSALQEALDQAIGGMRQVVFVSGEAGIGKTALIDLFARQLEPSVLVAVGQCVPGLAGNQDYYPISDAWRQIGNAPIPAGAPPGEVCATVEQIAGEKPLLLFLEDLHWADEPALSVLSALARRRGPVRLLIVATLVPQTGSAAHALNTLISDLRMRRLCTEIELARLSRTAITELMLGHLKQPCLPPGLADFIYQHSEGNPRFALAILDHLIKEKTLLPRGAEESLGWELRGPLEQADAVAPDDLARMVDLEIEHLTPYEQNILEAASLVPVAFPAWLVAAALGDDVAQVEERCDELARRLSIVKRAGEDALPDGTRSSFYVFAHALYREVLYRRQSPARRSVRHLRVAERLRHLFRGREEFIAREAAAHYEAAGDLANAMTMLHVAARRALATRAYVEVEELHRQVARLAASLSEMTGQDLRGEATRELAGASLDRAPRRRDDRL